MVTYYRIQPLPFGYDEKQKADILRDYYEDIRKKNYIILGYTYWFNKDLRSYTDEEIEKIIRKKEEIKENDKDYISPMVKYFKKIKKDDVIFVFFPLSFPFPEDIKGKSLIGVVEDKPYEFNTGYGVFSSPKRSTGHNHILHVKWLPELCDIGKGGNDQFSLSVIRNKEFIQKIKNKIKSYKVSSRDFLKFSPSSKNLILYGPPGTGKTFKTREKSVSRIIKQS